MKLIDKDSLVAEIKARISDIEVSQKAGLIKKRDANKKIILFKSILSLIDTLEVKEVDFDVHMFTKGMSTVFNLPSSETKNTEENPLNWEYAIAKQFFKLGLKVQHDNWKVVDNINPPQADRNKIYCVFTKGRYILAKVICDPQDEDLLQWKCTEFPFHRYDMCEGDKYMQIV